MKTAGGPPFLIEPKVHHESHRAMIIEPETKKRSLQSCRGNHGALGRSYLWLMLQIQR